MAVTPTGSDGSLPVTIVAGSISSSSSEKTTLASCTTLDELYKIAVTGTGQASSPAISYLPINGMTSSTPTTNTWYDLTNITTIGSGTGSLFASQTLNVVSGSANDAAAGTGARTIKIWGIDSNYAEISETVTMNGASLVSTTNSYIAVNKVQVMTVGSGLTNAGIIDITNNANNAYVVSIPASEGTSKIGGYTVPSGKSLVLYEARGSISLDSVAATIVASAMRFTTSHPTTGNKIHSHENVPVHSGSTLLSLPMIVIPEKTTLVLQGKVSTANTKISGSIKAILVGSVLTAPNYWA
jgi:hypothetical protein